MKIKLSSLTNNLKESIKIYENKFKNQLNYKIP